MVQIYQELISLIRSGAPCALATIVSASGSSPQNAGAKVLFLPDGRIIGTIGGGCMEAEARRVGLDCLRKRQPKLFDMRLDDDFGWDDGLICGGKVSVFINPSPDSSCEVIAAALLAVSDCRRCALVTLLSATGETAGRMALVYADGAMAGTLGPAASAEEVVDSALAALKAGQEMRLSTAAGADLYIEPIVPRPRLVIAGAGHIGNALCQIASLCGFEVTVVDDRPALMTAERLPSADHVVIDDIPRFFSGFTVDSDTYIAIVTRGHRHDAHVLRECVHSSARYIGMIGSKRKICVIFEEFLRDGLATREELTRIHSPMGLRLNDREVGEIAVSIMAEIIAVRNGADPSSISSMQYTPPFLR